MAKKSYKKTYPKLRWVLLLAIAISIPVTVWTFNTAPTETRSNAATPTCSSIGGGCYKYNCPKPIANTYLYESASGTCSVIDTTCCKQYKTNKITKSPSIYISGKSCNSGSPLIQYKWQKITNTSGNLVSKYEFFWYKNNDPTTLKGPFSTQGLASYGLYGFSSSSVTLITAFVRGYDLNGKGPISNLQTIGNPCK